MARQRARPKPNRDVKKELEAALGEELSLEAVQKINLWSAVGSYSFSFTDSYTAFQNLIVAFPKYCNSTSLLDVSGFAATGSDGTATFRLTRFVCLGSGYFLGLPINVV